MSSLDGRSCKILWSFFQSTKGSNPKSFETKSGKFSQVLKHGSEDNPPKQMLKWFRAGQTHHLFSCSKHLLWRNQDISGWRSFNAVYQSIWLFLSHPLNDVSYLFHGSHHHNGCDSQLKFLASKPAERFSQYTWKRLGSLLQLYSFHGDLKS